MLYTVLYTITCWVSREPCTVLLWTLYSVGNQGDPQGLFPGTGRGLTLLIHRILYPYLTGQCIRSNIASCLKESPRVKPNGAPKVEYLPQHAWFKSYVNAKLQVCTAWLCKWVQLARGGSATMGLPCYFLPYLVNASVIPISAASSYKARAALGQRLARKSKLL